MKILKMRLENFQGVKELEIDPQGESSAIYGDNGTGKSTVYNAFTWLMYGKSCVDYLGRFRDIPVAVEAKHTQGARIDFSAVQDHQAEYLDAWMEGEGRQLAFVAVSFGMNRFFMVPWSFWKAARDCWERHKKTKQKEIAIVQQYGWTWETPGTASAKAEDLLPDWEVDTGGFYGLQYLQIIDKIAGGETKNENRGPGNNTI